MHACAAGKNLPTIPTYTGRACMHSVRESVRGTNLVPGQPRLPRQQVLIGVARVPADTARTTIHASDPAPHANYKMTRIKPGCMHYICSMPVVHHCYGLRALFTNHIRIICVHCTGDASDTDTYVCMQQEYVKEN